MRLRLLAHTSIAALALALAAAPASAADAVPMLAHRALYQLGLESVRGGDVGAATGSMAYEVSDVCDGWATRQRLSLSINNRDGQPVEMVSDYATLESKDGLSLSFRMRQTTDTAITDQVEGTAKLDGLGEGGTIHYTVPEAKDVKLPVGTLFPMKHTEAIIAAAGAGRKFFAIPIFDGTGDRGAQDSFVVLGDWGKTEHAAFPLLAALDSGKVHVSFFDRDPKPSKDKVAGSPDYEVGMTYYANGVADDLHMDFGDFMMQGKLAEFTPTPPHC